MKKKFFFYFTFSGNLSAVAACLVFGKWRLVYSRNCRETKHHKPGRKSSWLKLFVLASFGWRIKIFSLIHWQILSQIKLLITELCTIKNVPMPDLVELSNNIQAGSQCSNDSGNVSTNNSDNEIDNDNDVENPEHEEEDIHESEEQIKM